MKTRRQSKILELIQKNDIETQEELSAYLVKEGYKVTQATVSRDIREMKLTKVAAFTLRGVATNIVNMMIWNLLVVRSQGIRRQKQAAVFMEITMLY